MIEKHLKYNDRVNNQCNKRNKKFTLKDLILYNLSLFYSLAFTISMDESCSTIKQL